MEKLVLLIAFCLLSCTSVKWQKDETAAFQLAKANKKLLVLKFYADY